MLKRALLLSCLLTMLAACDASQHKPVVSSTPPTDGYYDALAMTVLKQGNYEQAAKLADTALAVEKPHPRAQRMALGIRADAALHTGRHEDAARDLAALQKLDPVAPPADIAAADAAIAAHPNRPEGYFARASLFLAAARYEAASSDGDIAVGLGSAALSIKGGERAAWDAFDAGRFQQTIDDLGDNSVRAAGQPYSILLLHLARARLRRDDRAEMERAVEIAGLADWPAPILAFSLGRINRDQLFAAADEGPDHETREGQRCEANFYAGEEASLHGDPDEARDLLRKAQVGCPTHFSEANAAGAERGRLGR